MLHRTRLWWNRRRSKDGWFLPEQFTEEWDRVDYEPFSENITDMATGVGAAGSFTPKSNIFHVGLVSPRRSTQIMKHQLTAPALAR